VGYLVEQGATVMCAHSGQASPAVPNQRVTVGGKPTVALSPPWTISGCAFPTTSGGPCVTATWTVGTTRVKSNGQPLVIKDGSASCVPTGVPLTVSVAQTKVKAT